MNFRFSLALGFSPVLAVGRLKNRFNGFPSASKLLKVGRNGTLRRHRAVQARNLVRSIFQLDTICSACCTLARAVQ
jgi:hypothetical protein